MNDLEKNKQDKLAEQGLSEFVEHLKEIDKDTDCPHCGRCRHCGRGGYMQPYYPTYPVYPSPPWQPWITWCGTTTNS